MGMSIRGPTGSTGQQGNPGVDGPTIGLLPFSTVSDISSTSFIKMHNAILSADDVGYVMHRAGYIVGISFQGECTVHNSGAGVQGASRINDKDALVVIGSIPGTGLFQATDYELSEKHKFSVGDVLNFKFVFDDFSGTIRNFNSFVEVDFEP